MESDKINLLNPLRRHFNFPSAKILTLPKKIDWRSINDGKSLTNSDRENFPLINEEKDGEYKDLINSINNYEDVFYANRKYDKADELRNIYCGHVMNHIQKCRNVLRKNNDRIREHGDKISSIRDEGFHRCRVMIILPTRHNALQVVHCLRSFMQKKHKVTKNWETFLYNYSENALNDSDKEEESGDDDGEDDDDSEDDGETSKAKELMASLNENLKLSKGKHSVKKRGTDFDEWTEGNTKEKFLFGIGVQRKLFSVKTPFPLSDIIIGSPLSIKELMDNKKNYLNQLMCTSSIEMVVMDRVEYMLMQNFDNINSCFERLNQTPRGGGDCVKLMNSTLRVYEWALSQQGNKYRQNIIMSSILHPFLKKIMSACHNFQGTTIFPPEPQYTKSDLLLLAERLQKQSENPVTKKAKLQCNDKISFTRLSFSTPVPEDIQNKDILSTYIIDTVSLPESRISIFRRRVVPILINKLNTGGVLLYFTMTIDLYNVQQLLISENLKVACISEDQDSLQIDKIITLFAKGAIKYLLITERFYALTRQRFGAARHLIYYSTPNFPMFATAFHEFLMHNCKATIESPHHIINICEDELFEQINSQLAFKVLYG